MQSLALAAAASAAAADNDALTWWLASACSVAFVLATAAAVLVSMHQRRQRLPHAPHYRRHSPTEGPNPHD